MSIPYGVFHGSSTNAGRRSERSFQRVGIVYGNCRGVVLFVPRTVSAILPRWWDVVANATGERMAVLIPRIRSVHVVWFFASVLFAVKDSQESSAEKCGGNYLATLWVVVAVVTTARCDSDDDEKCKFSPLSHLGVRRSFIPRNQRSDLISGGA